MNALPKEPESRYEFAEDVGRYLGFRPVLARRGTYRYVAGKFVRRHWPRPQQPLLAASAALVIRESQMARLVRERAQRRFNEVRHLAPFRHLRFLQDKIAALPPRGPGRQDGFVFRLQPIRTLLLG